MKLLPDHKKAIEALWKFISEGKFYLAGGTAVYYYLNHRESIDLDFFTQKNFDFLQQHLSVPGAMILYRDSKTIHIEIKGVKVSFFHYPYPLIRPLNYLENIPVAHLEDILCMKVNAIINRGSRKDFIDVYFIMQFLEIDAKRCIELFQEKFGPHNPLVIRKAMVYFADADREPELRMLKPVKWEEVKRFFIREFVGV